MNFKNHLIGAASVSATIPILAYLLKIQTSFNDIVTAMIGVVIGGNFPDVDIESAPSRYYALGASIASIYWYYVGTPEYIWFILVPFLAAKIFVHRSWSHSYLLPLLLILSPVILGIAVSYFPSMNRVYYFIHRNYLFIQAFSLGICVHNHLDSRWIWKKSSWLFNPLPFHH